MNDNLKTMYIVCWVIKNLIRNDKSNCNYLPFPPIKNKLITGCYATVSVQAKEL